MTTLLTSRPQLASAEFGPYYYADSPRRAQIASKLREIMDHSTKIDLAGLHPGDRFEGDLQLSILDSLAVVLLIVEIEEEWKLKIPNSDAQYIHTFMDLVNYLDDRSSSPE
ncbi:MAG: hypothetical protein GY847_11195 [Proteobacteria bacterium]|nr:hypothetical protein [Pseudomonadota bacterium]